MTRRRPPALRRDDRFKTRNLRMFEQAVIGKLAAEGLTIDSPWADVERCLAKTVSPTACLDVAKRLRTQDTSASGGDDASAA